jgi:protein-S-isoprenylcysteine O-methyltransferase Ste14
LLPVEWLLPPILIFLEQGEMEADWPAVRFLGLALALCGAGLLLWASVVLGRFLVHAATVFQDHVLIGSGPYRFVRHPIYSGYLALLLGSALGTLNIWLLLLWPVSLAGILLQAGAEEKLLEQKFGPAYQSYAARTGQLLPRCLEHL